MVALLPTVEGNSSGTGMFPAVKGRLTDMALRAPAIVISVVDLTVKIENKTTW